MQLSEIVREVQSGRTRVKSRVEEFLRRCEAHKHLNAYLEVFAGEALQLADALDQKPQKRKLAGVILGIKDNICYRGHKVSAASRILESFVSPYNATVIDRLLKEDAIILGRLNCDEFAMGGSNENSAFGPVLNPYDIRRVPGGSSGGSAAAVAAGLCDAALGSDTGGSIRQPASFCGVVGVKPTYGRVSRYGLIAYASSFDQIGPITNSVEDAALLLEIIAGADEADPTCSRKPVPSYSTISTIDESVSVAYLSDTLLHPSLDRGIADRIQHIVYQLEKKGHQVIPEAFSLLEYIVPAYYTMVTAEASSNLARYDGIHYGFRSPEAGTIDEVYSMSRTTGFGKEVQRRIMAGTFVLSAGYYDAYYAKAQKIRRLIRERTLEIFRHADVLILPTTPNTAFFLNEKSADPLEMYLQDIFTVHANLAGIPAMTIPAGMHSNGMPFGIQICCAPFEEQKMFAFARYLSGVISG